MTLATSFTPWTGAGTPAGVTAHTFIATLGGKDGTPGIVHQGVRTFTPAVLNGYGMLFRGGLTGAQSSLTDSIINQMGEWSDWNTASQNDPFGGNLVITLGGRGTDGSTFTDGVPILGVDGLGDLDTDIEDYVQMWALGREVGLTGTPIAGEKSFLAGFSTGALRACIAVRERRIKPDVLILRSPLCNIYDWDALPGTNKAAMAAMMGFTTVAPETKTFKELTRDEQLALKERSPVQWAHKMPKDVPVVIIQAGMDNKVPTHHPKQLLKMLESAGVPCEYFNVPTAGHGFTTADEIDISNGIIRKTLTKYMS